MLRASRRLPASAPLLLLCGLLGACGDGVPPASRPPEYPVRLLPELDEVRDDVLIDQGFDGDDALAGWFVVSFAEDSPTLLMASLSSAVRRVPGGVVIDRPGSALVRFFDVPAGRGVAATATLRVPRDLGGVGDADFQFAPLRELRGEDALARLVGEAGGSPRELLEELARGLAVGRTMSSVRWNAVPADAHPATAHPATAHPATAHPAESHRGEGADQHVPGDPAGEPSGDQAGIADGWRDATRGTAEVFSASLGARHLRALALASRRGPVSIERVEVRLAPVARALAEAEFVGGEAPVVRGRVLPADRDVSGAPRWKPVVATIGYERRDALLLRPGATVEFAIDDLVPGDIDDPVAARLTYGVAFPPDAPESRPVVWRARLVHDDPARSSLVDEAHLAAAPAMFGRFHDRSVPIRGAAGARTLRFENIGDGPLVLAEPIVRGPRGAGGPNLLLISVDTLRADRLGALGYPRPTTPFLDAVAAEAAVFQDYRSVAPYTLPSHVTMFSGLLPPRHGVFSLSSRVDERLPIWLPELLAGRGYATAAFTAGGYVSPAFGFARGFDRYGTSDPMLPLSGTGLTPPRPSPRRTLDHVADWLFQRRNERWFAFVHTYAVHNYFAPEETFARFDSGAESAWRGRLDEAFPQDQMAPWRDHPPTEADVRHLSDLYDATVRYVDDELAHFFERLRGSGALDDTVVVITSDHGEEFWEHGNLRHSISVYEEMIRVPLLVWYPGDPRPTRVDEPTTQADLLPTLLDLLELPVPSTLDGRSRAGRIRGDGSPGASSLLLAHVDTAVSRRWSLREGRFKVVYGDRSPALGSPSAKEWQLFDLASDPSERDDLSSERAAELSRLRDRMARALEELRAEALDGGAASVDPALAEELRQLGYVR